MNFRHVLWLIFEERVGGTLAGLFTIDRVPNPHNLYFQSLDAMFQFGKTDRFKTFTDNHGKLRLWRVIKVHVYHSRILE
jgi:hypothetical protein